MRFAAGMQLGNYEAVASLGAGGMGEVYRARDPERLARFECEVRVLAWLNHPNIIEALEALAWVHICETPPGPEVAKLQLWICPRGSLTAQVVAGADRVLAPSWSPDSRFVGFYSESKIKKVDVAGGPPQTLCDAPSMPGGGTWNRDGVIVFGHRTNGGLHRVAAAGG